MACVQSYSYIRVHLGSDVSADDRRSRLHYDISRHFELADSAEILRLFLLHELSLQLKVTRQGIIDHSGGD